MSAKASKWTLDLAPLKKYRDFKILWSSGFVSRLGSMATYVTLPYQLWHSTHSYFASAILGVVEIVPLILASTIGGVLADHHDRQKIVWMTEAGALFATGLLLINSYFSHPSILVLYFVGALYATIDGFQRPSMGAIAPQLVSHDDQPAANALNSMSSNFATIAGPSLGGLMIQGLGVSSVYIFNLVTFAISVALLMKIKKTPIANQGKRPGFTSVFDGFSYAWNRKDLLGTYIVDLLAMILAMPNVLFPAWVEKINKSWSLGLFYAAGTVGALLVGFFSSLMGRFKKHGRGVVVGALAWGAAIFLAGTTNQLWIILFSLIAAGGADMISVYYRSAIWNQSITDDFRGRLASIEQLSYSVGPLLGQLRAASLASWSNLRFSVSFGGVSCIFFIILALFFLPKMWSYDVETDENVAIVRKEREKHQNF